MAETVKRPTRNINVTLPERLLQRFRTFAASRNQSMSSLMAEAVQKMVADGEYERARESFMNNIRNARDLGLRGKIPWTRDQLHER